MVKAARIWCRSKERQRAKRDMTSVQLMDCKVKETRVIALVMEMNGKRLFEYRVAALHL